MKHILQALIVTFLLAISGKAQAQLVYGLDMSNRLFTISADNPSSVGKLAAVTGIPATEQLLAIDMQPGTGELYALTYNAFNAEAGLYMIDMNGPGYVASPVNTSIALQLGTGANAGFDFNPVNNTEIYITGSNGNVYIIDAGSGDINFAGGSIFYDQGDINAGQTPVVNAVAYTNNFWGADKALSLGYDMNNNVLVRFDENVNATIHTIGLSGLSLSPGSSVGIDSYFDTTGFTNVVFIAARPSLSSSYSLLRIDPETGLASNTGTIGSGTVQVRDIAVDINQGIPGTVIGQLITALTLNRRNLVFFDSHNPAIIRDVKTISGVTPGQKIIAIDYRPFDLDLYGLGYNNANMQYQVYRIDVLTGSATPINLTPETIDLGTGTNVKASFDFNPFNDRMHVIGSNGLSYHLSPTTGLILNTDNNFTYATTDINYGAMASIGAVAYTNSYFNSSLSQRLGIDYSNRAFITFTGNDFTTLNTMASLAGVLDTGQYTNGYLDVYYADATQNNTGYLATNINNFSQSYLYSIDPLNGSTSMLGVIGFGIPVVDIAAQLTYTGATIISANDIPLSADGIYLYPNPARNEASVLLPSIARQRVSVTILDFNGNILQSQVYKPGGNQVNLDLSGIPAGMYSLRVQEYGFPPESVKLIKQ